MRSAQVPRTRPAIERSVRTGLDRPDFAPEDRRAEPGCPRMNRNPVRDLATTSALACLVAACGGGGGGSSSIVFVPTLVQAAVVPDTGSGADALLLLYSDAVELTGASLAGDLDVAGGSLGALDGVLTRPDARTVRIELGSGTAITPGVTRVGVTLENDAVRATGNGPAIDAEGEPVTITLADLDPPTATVLTFEGIDDELSGTGPADGVLQVPPTGFTIDLEWTDATSGIASGEALLISNRDVQTPSGTLRAGVDLTRVLPRPTIRGNAVRFEVPTSVVFPPGDSALTTLHADASGQPGIPRTFRFRTVNVDDGIRPTETTQVWFLSFDRDVESFVFDGAGLEPTVRIVAGANGRADALDALGIVGLWSASPLTGLPGGIDSNEWVRETFEARMLAELDDLFTDVDARFTFVSPGSYPTSSPFLPYGSFPFSQICIAGAAAETPTGTLGAAYFDANNQTQNDNCSPTSTGERLGVFLHTLILFGVRSGPASLFRQTYDAFTPGFGGTPVGEATGDRDRLLGTLNDARAAAIDRAIQRMARTTAVITAHECGHSMGLVANGAMPVGLYGGDPVNFPTSGASASLHIENRSLFPSDAQNVMSPAIAFEKALSPETAFNSLNRAYLREKALYDKQ
jgi:hypothetical protein